MRRIAALDMLRGFALVCIMLDHMPISVLHYLTLTNYAVFDAAELFVLLSGFLVGLVWVKVEREQGRRAAQWRFLKRAYQVWLALVIGAVVLALFSWLLFHLKLNHTAVWFQYSRWIVDNPAGYIATVALMWMQPNLLDVLALYVLLIATAPVTVPFILNMPFTAMLVSVGVWFISEPLNWLIPNQRTGLGLLFNPFGWQLLFFLGVTMGAFRREIMPVLRQRTGVLNAASFVILAFSLAIVVTGKIGAPAKPVSDVLRQVTGPIDKWSLDGMRLIAIMAATWVVAVPMQGAFAWVADTVMGRALGEIGRGGLWAFVCCVLLSIWGDAMQMLAPGGMTGMAIRLLIDIWMIVTLWGLSALWLRRDAWMGRLGPKQRPR